MKELNLFDMQLPESEKLADGSNLLYKPLEEVMATSMLPYAEHVILDRALPRVEDGLKPVQRRILYSMYEQGVLPDKAYRKSARIVGDCMGRYHPHGDSSIYDAMVRMAQPFSLSATLVDGQGNFGNIDGDSAAAMRYTEARLSPIALELIRDIDKDTVHWSRNFDDTTREPDMLPGRYPNLLVNGASGIAVGLATNIPPHNLGEVIDGVIAFIENRNITLSSMMKIIKGPDFPTGGHVITGTGLETAYETGKGKILIRAKVSIEKAQNDRVNLVITELPYQVNKSNLLMKIAQLKDDKKDLLNGIAEIVDESDKEGMRAVIKLKKDANAQNILNVLYKHTALEQSFGINMVAIADGKPQLMGLLDIIAYYTNYQREVILRRCKFELAEAKARQHILQGLVIAVSNIDRVIAIIKGSASTSDAKQNLRTEFDLSDRQAQAILDLRLARITKLESTKLTNELAELDRTIDRLNTILGSRAEQMNVIKTELANIKRLYKENRRSKIATESSKVVVEDLTQDKPAESAYVVIDGSFTVKRVGVRSYNATNKETLNSSSDDVATHVCEATTDSKLMIFTDFGNCYQTTVDNLPDKRFSDKGRYLSQLFKGAVAGEKPVALFTMPQGKVPDGEVLFSTRQGTIKRTKWSDLSLSKNEFSVYNLKDKDSLISVAQVNDANSQIFVITANGMCTRYNMSEVSVYGRATGGVKMIDLVGDDEVVSAMEIQPEKGDVLMITNKAFCKRVAVSNITKCNRPSRGTKGIDIGGKNGKSIVFASYLNDNNCTVAMYGRASTVMVKSETVKAGENRTTMGKLPKGATAMVVEDTCLIVETPSPISPCSK